MKSIIFASPFLSEKWIFSKETQSYNFQPISFEKKKEEEDHHSLSIKEGCYTTFALMTHAGGGIIERIVGPDLILKDISKVLALVQNIRMLALKQTPFL